ncbi:MAG TPA: acetylglutamate kinase [Urbifossiella sp.]|nr:acetylglutamate kinase [Urbifossiella sp.]
MAAPPLSAEAVVHAVERLARYRDQTAVVKLGGSAMEDPAATDACLRSVAVLNRVGIPIVLVHGGGKPIDRAMAEAGLTPKKVAGRRYTDDAALAVVVRILKDELNVRLARQLCELGGQCRAVPALLKGERLALAGPGGRAIDLGRVGSITGADWNELRRILDGRMIPIIPSLAVDADGHWLNVNADTAAAAVAGALQAEKAIFLTDTPGVLRDRNDPASLLPRLTEQECRALIAAGVIEGGMVPKVEACFEALAAGAKSALILDGREPFSLLDVFLNDAFTGTEIQRERAGDRGQETEGRG